MRYYRLLLLSYPNVNGLRKCSFPTLIYEEQNEWTQTTPGMMVLSCYLYGFCYYSSYIANIHGFRHKIRSVLNIINEICQYKRMDTGGLEIKMWNINSAEFWSNTLDLKGLSSNRMILPKVLCYSIWNKFLMTCRML